ncbi:MAG TPA: ABC transporter permease [Pyrinomonadaceae bacterium]|nr:ABC transporter permease [Pyrinomonadaceae bacterium]
MRFTETFRLALATIWLHKLRSALTLLGIVISISAVVIIVSLIQGFNVYVDEKIAGIGAKFFTIDRFSINDLRDVDAITAALKRNKYLTLDEYDYLQTHATLIDKIGVRARPLLRNVNRGRVTLPIAVDGATPTIAEIEHLDIASGRFFTDGENDAAARVAVIGADVADNLFSTGEVVGQEIKIAGLPYRVVGVAAAKGTIFGIPQDSFVTVPLRAYEREFGPLVRQRSLFFNATAKSDEGFAEAVEEARQLMRLTRRLHEGENDNFGIITPDSITQMRDAIFGPIFIVAIAVPSIALGVGAIVIANTMLVSVTERTREIGLRKAVGARRRDILWQFLIEAMTISAIGGVIGVFVAWLAGQLIDVVFFQTYLSPASISVAIGVSAGVGMMAGIMPAWKAARLDPVKALGAE